MGTKSTTVRIRNGYGTGFNYVVRGLPRAPDWAKLSNPGSVQTHQNTVTSDDFVAGYKRLISEGREATSNLSGRKHDVVLVPGTFAYGRYTVPPVNPKTDETYWNYATGHFCLLTPYTAPLSPTTTAINRAKAAFINKCLEEQSAFRSGPFIGELKETLQMIRQPAKALRRGLDDFFTSAKRRRKGSKEHRRRVAAETWLEHQFGWAPFISDIASASRALDNIRNRRLPFKMVRGYGRDNLDVPKPLSVFGSGNLDYFESYKEQFEYIVKYFGVVNLHVSPGISMTAQNLGFRWDQFVPTLWELAPWSFLVDYFSNIGDIITSWSYASSNLRWVSRTYITMNNREKVAYGPHWVGSPGYSPTWVMTPASARATSKVVSRSPTVGSLVPSLEFEIPGSRSLKWLNLAALAATRRSLSPY